MKTEKGPWNPSATATSHSTSTTSGTATIRTGEDRTATNPRIREEGIPGIAVGTAVRGANSPLSPLGRAATASFDPFVLGAR